MWFNLSQDEFWYAECTMILSQRCSSVCRKTLDTYHISCRRQIIVRWSPIFMVNIGCYLLHGIYNLCQHTKQTHTHTHTWISPVNQHLCAHCDISITEASQEGTKPKLSYNKPQLHGKACKNWGHTLHCLFVIQITVNDIYPCGHV